MSDEQAQAVEKARDAVAAAKLLLDNGFAAAAASRAYYAMFYTATAFLVGKGLRFRRHRAVIAAFGQHFANTDEVPRRFHRTLMDAEEVRHTADYEMERRVGPEQARELISQAEEFLQFAEQHL